MGRKVNRKSTTADEPESIARAGRGEALARLDCVTARCAELEKLLTLTTILARHLEFQRNCMAQGAKSSLGLLKLAASGSGTLDDRAACIGAIGKWLEETANSVIPPVPWVGVEPQVKH